MSKLFGKFFKEKAKTFDQSRPSEIRLKPKAKSTKSSKKDQGCRPSKETEMLPSHLLTVYRTPFKPLGHRPEDYLSDARKSQVASAKSVADLKRLLRHGIVTRERPRAWRLASQLLPFASASE